MKAGYLRSYRKSETGNVVFVYGVKGTQKEMEQYKIAQGEYFTEDKVDGVLWFSPQFVGQTVELLITSKGKVVADMSKFDMAQSLVNQYKGALGAEIAKQAVGMLLGSEFSGSNANTGKDAPVESKPESAPEDLENL